MASENKTTYYIVVLPYEETDRLFGSSKSVTREAFIGVDKTVWFSDEAKRMSVEEAMNTAISSGNTRAYVREINVTIQTNDMVRPS